MTLDATNPGMPGKALMTADCISGVWGYALELSRLLTGLGIEVHLATMGRLPSESQRAEAATVPGLTLHPSEFRLEWMDDPWEDVADAGDWLLALERELRPDIVHLNDYANAALPFEAPKLVVAHSCVYSWWHAVRDEEPPPAWEEYRAHVRIGLLGADSVAAPTATMLRALRTHYGFPGAGRVIPNGCDPRSFRPLAKDHFVITAGHVWDEGKNVAAVARAASRVAWPVFIAGDESLPDDADGSPRTTLGAQHLGRLSTSQLARWMGRAAICAMPARYEPFGLIALQAGLAGCALVLGDIPTQRELWGNAPLWVSPDDEKALARAICALSDDGDLRELLAARCRETALRYTTERMRDAYVAAYADVRTRRLVRANAGSHMHAATAPQRGTTDASRG